MAAPDPPKSLSMVSTSCKASRIFSTENRKQCAKQLYFLHDKIAVPICKALGLRFALLKEQPHTSKKPGVTKRAYVKKTSEKNNENPTSNGKVRWIAIIRIRVRDQSNPVKFVSLNSQIAVLLHELAHLKHMNHGVDFMLTLCQIYRLALKLKAFHPAHSDNVYPSKWEWERQIYQTAGHVDQEELLELFHNGTSSSCSSIERSLEPAAGGARLVPLSAASKKKKKKKKKVRGKIVVTASSAVAGGGSGGKVVSLLSGDKHRASVRCLPPLLPAAEVVASASN